MTNSTLLNVERGHIHIPLPWPLAHHQYTRQDCQVNIRCSSPRSSIDIDCIHLFSKSSSFFSSFMYDSESFVETEDKKKKKVYNVCSGNKVVFHPETWDLYIRTTFKMTCLINKPWAKTGRLQFSKLNSPFPHVSLLFKIRYPILYSIF